jgi:hypothetical protein
MQITAAEIKRAIREHKADFLVLWLGEARILASRAILRDAFGAIPNTTRITLDLAGEFSIRERSDYSRRIDAGTALQVRYELPGVRSQFRIVNESGWHAWGLRRAPTVEALDLNSMVQG